MVDIVCDVSLETAIDVVVDATHEKEISTNAYASLFLETLKFKKLSGITIQVNVKSNSALKLMHA